MSDWQIQKLSDVIEIIGGGTPKRSEEHYWNGDIDWLSVADFNNDFRFVTNSSEKITELGLKNSSTKLLQKGQLIISARGTVGCLAQLAKPMAFNQSCYGLNGIKDIIDNDFLYYFLKHNIGILKSKTHGSVFDTITRDTFEHIEINFPNLDKQKEIAEILGDFDKKIQLNTQTNQTLEAIAQAIFKSWFVDFDPVRAKAAAILDGKTRDEANLSAMAVISGKDIDTLDPAEFDQLYQIAKAFPSELVENEEFGEVPKGWELTTLSEICTMQNGYAFKSSDWRDNGIPVIKIGSVKPMIVDIESNGFVAEENKFSRSDFLLTAGDIVVGLTGYVGEVGRIPAGDEAMLNQRVAKFIPKKLEGYLSYYNFVYCLARQKNFKEYAELNAKGSAQANISTKELLNYPVCIGNKKIHLLFEKQVNSMLKQILTNSQENKSLSKTRDLLLPRLLSGEI